MSTNGSNIPEKILAVMEAPPRIRRRMANDLFTADPAAARVAALVLLDRVAAAESAVTQSSDMIGKLQGIVHELTEEPLLVACVVAVEGDHCLVAVDRGRQRVKIHSEWKDAQLQVGDIVYLPRNGNAVLERVPNYRPACKVAVVSGWHNNQILIDLPPDRQLALDPMPALLADKPRVGDKILYNEEWGAAWELVEKVETLTTDEFERVGWDEIGGLEEQVRQLKQELETRFLRPELTAALKIKPFTGMIVEGPPGGGKTMLFKALATWVQTEFGRRVVFRSVPPGSWRDSLYGVTERRIVEPIKEAKRLLAEKKADLVIVFYDELDTVGARSGDSTNRIDSRVLTALLAEIDGIGGQSGILLGAATNRLDLCDESLLRAGRFGSLILQVGRPGREAARSIFRCHLKPDIAFHSNGHAVPPEEMAERSIDAALGRIYKDADPQDALAEMLLMGGRRQPIWARDVISGAAIANIVERAKRMALARGLVGPLGLVPEDLAQAADDELDSLARRLTDRGKVREILGDRDLPIDRIEPRRLARGRR